MLTTACTSPQLFRRYASATATTASAPDQHARLSAFVLADATDLAPPFVLQLDAPGQGSFIKAISDRTDDADEFTTTLWLGRDAAETAARTPDRTRFRKRIVLTVERAENLPAADRLEKLAIRLSAPAHTGFVSWDKFATQYETIDLGKLTFQGTRGVEAGLDAGPLPGVRTPVSGTLAYKQSRDLKEELSVRPRCVTMSGALSATEARLYQESLPGIDLAGNATLDLVLEAAAAPQPQAVLRVGALRQHDGWVTDSKLVSVEREFIRYPAQVTPITCWLSGDYQAREVTRNGHTWAEGDDAVRLVRGRFADQELELVSADELAMRVWAIQTPDNDLLYLDPVGVVEFASYREAALFLGWLRATQPTAVGGYVLRSGGQAGPAVTAELIPLLQVAVRQINVARP